MTDKHGRETRNHTRINGKPGTEGSPVAGWDPVDTGFPEGSAEDRETLLLLREGLDRLDSLVPVLEPDPRWMEARLEEHRQQIRKRFVRDLVLFLCTAMLVLILMAAVLFKVPAAFFVLQAAVLLVAPAVLIRRERKRVGGS